MSIYRDDQHARDLHSDKLARSLAKLRWEHDDLVERHDEAVKRSTLLEVIAKEYIGEACKVLDVNEKMIIEKRCTVETRARSRYVGLSPIMDTSLTMAVLIIGSLGLSLWILTMIV